MKLDGAEDSRITREALEFWKLCDMLKERPRAIAEVDAAYEAGLRWDGVDSLIRHLVDPGVFDEGWELEGPREPEDPLWDDDEVLPAESDDEQLVAASNPLFPPLAAHVDDDPDQVEVARLAAEKYKRLATVKRLASDEALGPIR